MAINPRHYLKRAASSVNEDLLDNVLRHATFVERYKTSTVNKMLKFVNRDVLPEAANKLRLRMALIGERGYDLIFSDLMLGVRL